MANEHDPFLALSAAIEKADIKNRAPRLTREQLLANPQGWLNDFCPIAKLICSILTPIATLPFIPKVVKDAIQEACKIIGTLCP
jgi:hypothetical protein